MRTFPNFVHCVGYEPSISDRCVMCHVIEGDVYIIIFYVNDILTITSQQELDLIQDLFIQKFKWITMDIFTVFSYLSMIITVCQG